MIALQTLHAYLIGMYEFRSDYTTHFDVDHQYFAYEAGREMAHRLSFRRYES